MKHIVQSISMGLVLLCLLSGFAFGIDWRELDPLDENSALRKSMDAGEW